MTRAERRPLTVLHVDTERGWRGGERQALWLAQALERAGHRSLVAGRPYEPFAMRAADSGLRVVPVAPASEFDPITVLRLRRVIRREDVDIVHAHTGHAVGLAALATVRSRARMVVTRRVDFRPRGNLGSRWKYARAQGMIAISRVVRDALVASGVAPARIDVVPDGIELDRPFHRADVATLAALGVPPRSPLVVQVAALVQHKDPLTFVRAMDVVRRRVPSVQALMVGEGDLRAAVEAEIATWGLGSVVRLTGFRTDADSLLAAADVVTLSSEAEGLGSVLLDALSIGKPVAATAGGGIPEVVSDGITGVLVPVRDAEALGDAIARILLEPALAGRLAAAGPPRAAEFSMELTAERTLAVYRRVLGG